jgi:GNAT superfamily N-acetyltransferase
MNSSTVTIQVEPPEALSSGEEGMTLFREHWEEIALYRDDIPLDPFISGYLALAAKDLLLVITARRDGILVGYSVFFLHPYHPHYKSCPYAMNDVLFVTKRERGGTLGMRLIKSSEVFLREKGYRRIFWHVKVQHDFGPLLKRLGYAAEDVVWGKLMR